MVSKPGTKLVAPRVYSLVLVSAGIFVVGLGRDLRVCGVVVVGCRRAVLLNVDDESGKMSSEEEVRSYVTNSGRRERW